MNLNQISRILKTIGFFSIFGILLMGIFLFTKTVSINTFTTYSFFTVLVDLMLAYIDIEIIND